MENPHIPKPQMTKTKFLLTKVCKPKCDGLIQLKKREKTYETWCFSGLSPESRMAMSPVELTLVSL
jgi:hypothetical protein